MVGIAHDANGGAAGKEHAAKLRGGHAEHGVAVVLAHELHGGASGARDSGALARLELDRVDQGAHGDRGERHGVAGLDVDVLRAGNDHVADLEALGSEDIGLLAVHIVEEGNAGRTIGVILDGRDLCRHVIVNALKVDATILALVSATLVTGGDAAVVVAASLLWQGLEKRLLGLVRRDLGEVRNRLEATACARRLEVLYCHY